MGFIEELPPLDERVIDDRAIKLLFFIGQKQENMIPARLEMLNKKFSGNGHSFYRRVYGLLNAGYIIEKVGVHSREAFTLTDKGWAVVGDKPMWLA